MASAPRVAGALPERLQTVMEAMSGFSLADVVVHRNSAEPVRLGAAAFTRGSQIHVAPGQERHLPHEAWHVVQQAQGRVRPTMQMKAGPPISDDSGLEREADIMGARASAIGSEGGPPELLARRALRLPRFAAGGSVQRKAIKIGGDKSVSNLQAFYKFSKYTALIEPYVQAFGKEAVDFHLSQMFSAPDDITFLSEQHFTEALIYDLLNKSLRDEPHTLQERYLTRYGWEARSGAAKGGSGPGVRNSGGSSSASGKGSSSVPAKSGTAKGKGKEKQASASSGSQGSGEPGRMEQLKIYRTLKAEDWEQLRGGDPRCLAGKHLGDFKQAQNYLFRNAGEGKPKLLIEFILKPQAELALFSPRAMEIQGDVNEGKVPKIIQSTLKAEERGTLGEGANANEGMVEDKIGLKMEAGESGFSFSISGGKSPGLFMSMVARCRVIGRSDGKAVVPAPDISLAEDQVVAFGHRFDPVDPRVRIDGYCLWDTLRVIAGYTVAELQQAATALRQEGMAIAFGRDVEDTHIWPLLQQLGARGLTLIRWQYGGEGEAEEAQREGDGSIVIGFVHDNSGAGHYVPPR